MRFKEITKIKGHMKIVLKDKDGKVLQTVEKDNTITNGMDAHVADQLSDSGDGAIGYMGVGTGSGQGASDTGLATPLVNVALTSTTQGTGADDNDVIYVGNFNAGTGTGALTEAGLFLTNDNTSMMAYNSFSVINKGASDTLKITWTITFGAS